jgi:excisionase family DNA binding protein
LSNAANDGARAGDPQIAEAVAEQERRRQAKLRKKRVEKRVGRIAYSLEEFAALMRVDQSTVFRWIKDGDIRSFKIGGRRYIPIAEVERLLGGNPAS